MKNNSQTPLPEQNESFYKEWFEMLANASPDCIKLFDLDNKVIFINQGGLKEHKFKKLKDAIGFEWTQTIVPEQREMVREKIKECVQSRAAVRFEIKHLPKFSNHEYDSTIVYPVFDNEDKIKYFVGISRDISEIKKAADELEQMNKFMVGRELRMVELKEENKKLREKLEKLQRKN